jgi:hypothetical protein
MHLTPTCLQADNHAMQHQQELNPESFQWQCKLARFARQSPRMGQWPHTLDPETTPQYLFQVPPRLHEPNED